MDTMRTFYQYFLTRDVIFTYVSDVFFDIREWDKVIVDFLEFFSDEYYVVKF